MSQKLKGFFVLLFLIAVVLPVPAFAQALEAYLEKEDKAFGWRQISSAPYGTARHYSLDVASQEWRGIVWRHRVEVIVPAEVRGSGTFFLLIAGSGDSRKNLDYLYEIASASRSVAAVVADVPNQPLFSGRKEDALLAFSFKQFLETGDQEWPLLFPMVKSVVRAIDAIELFAGTVNLKLDSVVVSGASKRGWTSYLTAAADKRVKGAAPLVFDMLNFDAQIDHAEASYGRQSEKIKDYTDLGIVQRRDEPRGRDLVKWVDPYSYRDRLTVPKLLLLGTNDPYWVVDSQKLYFFDLPAGTLIYQVPNGGHHISGDKTVRLNLINWYRSVLAGDKLPEAEFKTGEHEGKRGLWVQSSWPVQSALVWRAGAATRDFRNAAWNGEVLKPGQEDSHKVFIPEKNTGVYSAFVGEIHVQNGKGDKFVLSAPAVVIP